jgi:hypothetical protein
MALAFLKPDVPPTPTFLPFTKALKCRISFATLLHLLFDIVVLLTPPPDKAGEPFEM